MDMYQHDSATMFQFVLQGDLIGDQVLELQHAWTTAKSILAGKELVVDISGMTNADPSGVDLLSRMRESGACLTAALPPASEEILRSLGVPVAAPRGWCHILVRRVRQGLQKYGMAVARIDGEDRSRNSDENGSLLGEG
jgi:ABC-type transporter Mla MlaB component